MFWMILIPCVAAGLAPWLHRLLGRYVAGLSALLASGLMIAIATHLPIEMGHVRTEAIPWIPQYDVALAFCFDGLSATFALLITGIGSLVLLYAWGYMARDPGLGRLCGLLLLFLGSMLGVVFSDDLFGLIVFWELTSISSYLLIGFKHEKKESREAARQALLVTGAGGLALLAGFILLAIAAVDSGIPRELSTRISALNEAGLSDHVLFLPALVLIVIGALSKSAQIPLHFWLPNAMTAPTPVSAYLHSATMVKAGIFLLARLNPIFGESFAWHALLTGVGAATMLIAAAMASGQTDLKRILAYTTVSVLGTLTMLIGIGTELAIKAAVVYLVAHACYKAALFMIAGILEHETGTRDIRRLGGLYKAMPVTMIAGILAALSMAGAPPLFGFIGKEMILKAKLDLEQLGVLLILVASVAFIFLIAMALVVAVRPFWGPRSEATQSAHEAPLSMLAGPMILSVTGLFIGLIPGTFDTALGSAMATAIGGREIDMTLKLWHGFSPVALTALGISTVTLSVGIVLFLRYRAWLSNVAGQLGGLGRYGPDRLYEKLYNGLIGLAGWVYKNTQTGKLSRYVAVILVTLIATSLYPLSRSFPPGNIYTPGWYWYELLLGGMILIGALAAVLSRSRLSAIAQLGITGLLIAFLFALFSAPDLAITQIMIEALTVILLVLIFYRLPEFVSLSSRWERTRNALIAGAAGAIMTGLTLASASVNLPATVSEQMATLAKPEAQGRNVVNVILVDFRALDTLGELTVVSAAGLGVYALVKLYRKRKSEGGQA